MKVTLVLNRDIQDVLNDYAINEIARTKNTITIFAMSMRAEENMLFVVASVEDSQQFYIRFDDFISCE
jgi:hypothetical protein